VVIDTLQEYFDRGSSLEATARALFVHANTVRYRLRRAHEVTGLNPSDPRDAYTLRVALTAGRLRDAGSNL
jgi:DNA-binding PucR family transcriptional regulator